MDREDIQELVTELEAVSELLYQEDKTAGYERFQPCLAKLAMFAQGLTDNEECEELLILLKPALKAMEAGDLTLLADIVQYDIITKLNEYT